MNVEKQPAAVTANIVLVMAGDFEQFELYRKSRGLSPKAITYLHRPQTAARHRGAVLIQTGTWKRRRDRHAIQKLINEEFFSDVREEQTLPANVFNPLANRKK